MSMWLYNSSSVVVVAVVVVVAAVVVHRFRPKNRPLPELCEATN